MDYEYSGKGITVQCLCPGPVATDMVRGILKGGVISKGIFTLFPSPQTNDIGGVPYVPMSAYEPKHHSVQKESLKFLTSKEVQ